MTLDLSSLGWDDHFHSAFRPHQRPDQLPARVTRVDRGVCGLLTADGPVRGSIGGAVLAAAARDPAGMPCIGDWVVVRAWCDQRTTIEAILPRRSRLDTGTGPVVTNVDTVAFVVPADTPDPLAAALAYPVTPDGVVLLTKVDLVDDPGPILRSLRRCRPSTPIYCVSATDGTGLAAVRDLAGPGRTLCLLGARGSGRSSLVRCLAGGPVLGPDDGLVLAAGGGAVIEALAPAGAGRWRRTS
jgi:ribosome biogenesis GTPase